MLKRSLSLLVSLLLIVAIVISLAACQKTEVPTKIIRYITRTPMPATNLITPTPSPTLKKTVIQPQVKPKPIVKPTVTLAPTDEPPIKDTPYDFSMPPIPAGTPMPITLPYVGNPDELSQVDLNYVKFFEDALNVKIKLINSNTMSARAAADTLPDVIPTTSLSSLYLPFIKQKDYTGVTPGSRYGMRVREIPESIIKNYPRLQEMMQSNAISKAIADKNGKYYSIPRLASYPANVPYNQSSFVVRKDWASKVGYSTLPNTVGGFADMMKKITETNPAVFKGEVAVGFAGKLQDLNFTPWIGAGLFDWIYEDGKLIPGYMSKNMEAALQYYRDLYAYQVSGNSTAKVIPDSFVSTNSDAAFNSGALNLLTGIRRRSSAYAVTASPQGLYKSLSQGFFANNYFNPYDFQADGKTANDYAFSNENVPISDILALNPPLALDGSSPAKVAFNPEISCTMFNSSVSDEKLDRILMLYDYILNGSGSDMVTYGLLNVDWNYTLNNVMQKTQADPTSGRYLSAPDIYKSQQIFTLASFAPTPKSKLYSNRNLTWNTDMSTAQNALLQNSDYQPRTGSVYSYVSINQYVSFFFNPDNYTDTMKLYPNIKKTDPTQALNIANFLKDRSFSDIIRGVKPISDYQSIRDKYSGILAGQYGGSVMTDMVNTFARAQGYIS